MYLGCDIGGSKIELVAFDESLSACWQKRVPTPTTDLHAFLDALLQLVHEAQDTLRIEGSLGLGVPGVINPDNGHLLCANVPCLMHQPLQKLLEERLERPVLIENDAKCFVLSEAIGGAGDGCKTLFGIILGTGVGGALCHHGQIYHGRNNLAGEWGHTPLPWSFGELTGYQVPIIPCGCGLTACLDRYLSGPGLMHIDAQLNGIPERDVPTLMAAYRQGERGARQSFNCYMELLATSLGGICNTLDPEMIVLGGGLSNVVEIEHELNARLGRYRLGIGEPPQIRVAKFGDSGGVRGAALLHYHPS